MGSARKIKTYLKFSEEPTLPGKKTKVWLVENQAGEYLGQIHWRTGWRRYVCVMDEFDTEWSVECLRELADFIDMQMLNRKLDRGESV
jgi:hypothetical protein